MSNALIEIRSMPKNIWRIFLLIAIVLCFGITTVAQPVTVTLILDTNIVAVGKSTVLHVYAEIAAEDKPATLQIFSWYVDFVNEDASIASANYSALQRPASDQ